jgi:pimeloyl-ACP methyl ester carboxylesterase
VRIVAALALWLLASVSTAAPPQRHAVAADGFTLTVWEKSPRKPRAAILLVHGRTWSALPNFDLQAEGRSVMDHLAAAGYAVYAVDLRGYGATPRDSSGWLTPTRAADDVAAVLRWIHAQRRLKSRPALLGYSRGAHVALFVAQRDPETLSSLVLYALPGVGPIAASSGPAEPPRRPTTRVAAAEDFITPGAASRDVIEAYVAEAVAANPVRVDWRNEDEFLFDAGKVMAPTLLLYGANDPLLDDGKKVFFETLATKHRRFVILADSDHAAHVENSHAFWIRAVSSFLESPRAKAPAN